MEWQTIDSAPKEHGKPILLYGDFLYGQGAFVGCWWEGAWKHLIGGSRLTVSHWMPIPALPETREAPLTVPGQTTFEDDLESGRLAIKGYTDYVARTTSGEEGGR